MIEAFLRRVVPRLVAAIAVMVAATPASAADRLLVFAAASLKNALDAADAVFTRETGVPVTVSFAASGLLAKQIENGAPADLFVSADLDWMDYLDHKALIRRDTRRNWLGNELVLIAPAASTAQIDLAKNERIAPLLAGGRLSIGDPQSVPAGKYAQAALTSLRQWDALRDHLAPAENVRAAMAMVDLGEAPFGIVYRSDAAVDPKVRVVATFPAASHPPIVYPVAITAASDNPAAVRYLVWLEAPEHAGLFTGAGFTAVPADREHGGAR